MSNEKPIRLAVIGAGHMGRLHAEKIFCVGNSDEALKLVAVVDPIEQRARQVAAETNSKSFTDYRQVLSLVDAVVVATPLQLHREVSLAALVAGVDVLVEKPIADSIESAEHMESVAIDLGRILHVGHQEWFNPAVQAAVNHIENPKHIHMLRFNCFSERNNEVDVVLDQMIHDIHIIQSILGEEPQVVSGIGDCVLSDSFDIVHVKLEFSRGVVAVLSCSRVAPERLRIGSFFSSDAQIHVNMLDHSAIVRYMDGNSRSLSAPQNLLDASITTEDTLTRQLRSFVNAVKSRKLDFPVRFAISALRTAERIRTSTKMVQSNWKHGLT